MSEANFGMLINQIQMNFGLEAARALENVREVMNNPEAWSQQMEAAWKLFESAIVNHK